MAKTTSSSQKISRKIWLGVIAGIIILALGWWAWNQFTPRPLGDRLEYLGKEDYGNIFGFDYFPASTYYYGTDMTVDEFDDYFSGASRTDNSTGTETWRKLFSLETADGKKIYFYFYNREDFLERKPDLHFPTDQDYIISISDSSYDTAKNAL